MQVTLLSKALCETFEVFLRQTASQLDWKTLYAHNHRLYHKGRAFANQKKGGGVSEILGELWRGVKSSPNLIPAFA